MAHKNTKLTRELPDPNLSRLANKTFDALSSYIQDEFQSTLNEFTLIKDMNTISNQKYGDMLKLSQNLSVPVNDLADKYNNILPLFEQIDGILDQVAKLENIAEQLNTITIKFEDKLK